MGKVNLSVRDRMQIRAFQSFFKCGVLINKQPAIIAFAYAIMKSSDIVFDKLSEESIQRWLDFKGIKK